MDRYEITPPGPKFVEFTDLEGNEVAVNPAAVCTVKKVPLTEFTRLVFATGIHVDLPAQYDDVLDKLDPAPPAFQKLHQDNAELNQLFELQHTRTQEAERRWRIAHPGNDLVCPDLGALIEWLLAEIDKQDHR